MIDVEAFMKNSPFFVAQGRLEDQPGLYEGGPETMKYHLLQQLNNKTEEIKANYQESSNLHLLKSLCFPVFNDYLQLKVEEGLVSFSNERVIADETEVGNLEYQPSNYGKKDKQNFVDVKIILENAMFDIEKMKKAPLLSIASVQALKKELRGKNELKEKLLTKYQTLQDFLKDMVFCDQNLGNLALDAQDLIGIFKQANELQGRLLGVSTDIAELLAKLNNHYISSLSLGYFEDVKISSLLSNNNSPELPYHYNSQLSSPGTIEKSLDSLTLKLVSTAARENVPLPEPYYESSETIATQLQWAVECIDVLLASLLEPQYKQSTGSPNSISKATEKPKTSLASNRHRSQLSATSSCLSQGSDGDRTLSEYRTALNDLKFSNQYLMKELAYSRESSMKSIRDYRRRLLAFENNEIKDLSVDSKALPGENENKDEEISKLRKEINILKVERINQSNSNIVSPTALTFDQNLSPMTPTFTGDESESGSPSLTKTFSGRPISLTSTSTSILKKEFKKIVTDILDQYEALLMQEKNEVDKLKHEIVRLKQL